MKNPVGSLATAFLLALMPLSSPAANAPAAVIDKSQISPSNDISPMEKHPECMDRTAEAQSAKCLEKDNGVPRRKYPPKPPVKAMPAPQADKAKAKAP